MNSRRNIFHLGNDLLQEILLLVVVCAGGATYLANIMAVCKEFAELGNGKSILKMVNFDNFVLPESAEKWLHTNSLLTKCAEAGHACAQYLLTKVNLLGYSQFLDPESSFNKRLLTLSHTDQANSSTVVKQNSLHSFLSYFTLDQATNTDPNTKRFAHFELVSLFLKQCSIADHVSMLPHVQIYVKHFGFRNKTCTKFLDCFWVMTGLLRAIVDVGQKRGSWFNYFFSIDGQSDPEMGFSYDVIHNLRLKVSDFFMSTNKVLSRLDWEELKSECQFIEEELISSESFANLIEENCEIVDLGNKFFQYIAFKVSLTQEIDLRIEGSMIDLLEESITIAEIYTTWQEKTSLAFDDMFFPKN